MIIVTGAAGFIGSHIVKGLNTKGHTDIVTVDDLTNGKKYINLANCQFNDYQDQEDFLEQLTTHNAFNAKKIEAIFHEGACSVTTEWDGRHMMRNNYDYTKQLFHYCTAHGIPFIYASSAAVYGNNLRFEESSRQEIPLNVYGYSKWLFDQYLLRALPHLSSQVVGYSITLKLYFLHKKILEFL